MCDHNHMKICFSNSSYIWNNVQEMIGVSQWTLSARFLGALSVKKDAGEEGAVITLSSSGWKRTNISNQYRNNKETHILFRHLNESTESMSRSTIWKRYLKLENIKNSDRIIILSIKTADLSKILSHITFVIAKAAEAVYRIYEFWSLSAKTCSLTWKEIARGAITLPVAAVLCVCECNTLFPLIVSVDIVIWRVFVPENEFKGLTYWLPPTPVWSWL